MIELKPRISEHTRSTEATKMITPKVQHDSIDISSKYQFPEQRFPRYPIQILNRCPFCSTVFDRAEKLIQHLLTHWEQLSLLKSVECLSTQNKGCQRPHGNINKNKQGKILPCKVVLTRCDSLLSSPNHNLQSIQSSLPSMESLSGARWTDTEVRLPYYTLRDGNAKLEMKPFISRVKNVLTNPDHVHIGKESESDLCLLTRPTTEGNQFTEFKTGRKGMRETKVVLRRNSEAWNMKSTSKTMVSKVKMDSVDKVPSGNGKASSSIKWKSTNGSTWKCQICKKYYYNKWSLKNHQITHTKEKRHECPLCQKRFSQPEHLKSHIRTHTKEKPYQCSVCLKRFTQSTSLKRHTQSQHSLEGSAFGR